VRAETEEDVMSKVADHAKQVHQVETITTDVATKVRKVMREEN
jgi:predicted small metal-binding protein